MDYTEAQWEKRGQEELPHVQGVAAARVQEGREELLHVQGQEGRPWEDSPHPRSGAAMKR